MNGSADLDPPSALSSHRATSTAAGATTSTRVMAPSAPFGPMLRTVCEAIFEVILMCTVGWVFAYKGMLDKKTQKQLNRFNVLLFTPCLLFSRVAFSLSPEKIKELWIIPILFIVVIAVSGLVPYVLGILLHLRRSQRNFAMAASMFSNSNSLPIAFMQSLVVTMKRLKWGKDDTQDAMLGRALGYLFLYATFGMILRWSYGVHLLAQPDKEASRPEHLDNSAEPIEGPDILAASSHNEELLSPLHAETWELSIKGTRPPPSRPPQIQPSASHRASPPPTSPSATSILTAGKTSFDSRRPPVMQHDVDAPGSLGNSREHNRHPGEPVSEQRHEAINGPDLERSTHVRRRTPNHALSIHLTKELGRRALAMARSFWVGFLAFMTMPLYAAAASIIVAASPPLKNVLNKQIEPVKGFLNSAGSCSIPLTLLILGAYFYEEPVDTGKSKAASNPTDESSKEETHGQGKASSSMRDVRNFGADDAEASGSCASGNSVVHTCTHAGVTTRASGKDGHLLPNDNATAHPSQPNITSPRPPPMTLAERMRGAFRMRGLRARLSRSKQRAKRETPAGETKTVIVAIISRMILIPILVLPLVAIFVLFHLHPVFDDPVFVCSIVLLISSPPALTLAQLTPPASGDAFERLISRTVFWAYCIVTPPLTLLYIIIALHLSRS